LKISKPVLFTLLFALAFGVYIVFFTGKKKTPPPMPPQAQEMPKGIAQPAVKPDEFKPDFSRMDMSWKRDPFVLPKFVHEKQTKQSKVAMKLVAILEGGGSRIAVIDNEIVHKGDMVGVEQVAEIGRDRIVLVRDKSRRVLYIQEPVEADSAKRTVVEGVK